MRYKLLGKTGIRVSEICLGTMTFGEDWGWGADSQTSKEVFDHFVEQGGNFFDTANRYTEGSSERILGELIASDRERFVVATKYTLYNRLGDVSASGNSRKNLVQSLHASLKRLGTDYIDLLWIHAWDFTTDEQEVMRALDDVVRAGKVLAIGISDTPAWIVSRSQTFAELRGWTQFCALQVEYSLLERSPERDLLPMARHLGLAITPWSPLAGGALTGKYLNKNDDPKRLADTSARLDDRNTAIVRKVVEVAENIGASPAQVALSWIRTKPGVMIPIVGARNVKQFSDSLGCLNVEIPAENLEQLNSISAVSMGFPHDFLQSPNIRTIVFGGMQDSIDNHLLT